MFSHHRTIRHLANIKLRIGEKPLLALILSLVMVAPAVAGFETFGEDFTTTQYMDPLNTTAHWDTVAGEIKLFPFEMSFTGSYPSSGMAHDVVIAYNHAFLADGAAGLVIIDVTDPAAPVLTGSYDTAGDATAVVLSGDFAFVADGPGGMAVLDISNLSVPILAGSFESGGNATGIAVDGNYAYLASGNDGLLVLDITDPTNPGVAGDFATTGDAVDVTVSGNHAFVATSNGSLQIFDITDPTSVLSVGSYEPGGSAWDVAVDGDLAILAAGGAGLALIDIEDPTNPSALGSLPITGGAYDVAIDGDMVYVSAAGSGLVVVDISDPVFPMISKNLDTPGSAEGVSLGDVFAFVADGAGGMQVVEVRQPMYPQLWGSYVTTGNGFDIEVAGDHAYIAMGNSGLEVVDISDPTNPSFAGSFELPAIYGVKNIDLEGNLAYLAYADSGLVVVDVSDPTAPVLAGIFNTFYPDIEPEIITALDVAVDGNVAYVVTENQGLMVLDVSDPSSPAMVGQYLPPVLNILDITVAGNHVYLACGDDGMYVVDISDPTTPTFAGSLILDIVGVIPVLNISVVGDVALVDGTFFGDWLVALTVDITDPTTPVWDEGGAMVGSGLAGHDIINSGSRFFAAFDDIANFSGGFAYFAPEDSLLNLQALTVNYNSPATARGIELVGDFICLVGDFGLEIVRVFSRDFLADSNIAQSLPIASDVAAVRIAPTQTGSISWQVGPDHMELWQNLIPGLWVGVTLNGGDLVWRSTLNLGLDGVQPTCSHLQLDYLFSHATIDSIADVPGDQGGWTRTYFTRSGRDIPAFYPIEDYIVWRRVDSESKQPRGATGDVPGNLVQNYQADFPELPLVERSGRFYWAPDQKSLPGFPPGTWEIVGSFPALMQEQYIYLTPTAGDYSVDDPSPSVHLVSAHANGEFWVSAPDSGYSIDNIAPGVPTTVTASYEADQVTLDWDDSPASDFQYFRIYRDTNPGFIPSQANLVQEVVSSAWIDAINDPWGYYYQITVLDHAGNESDAAAPENVSGVQSDAVPARTILLGAAPNPFNPSTKLSFEMAVAGHAQLKVYDTAGRLVVTLVNERRGPGLHEVIWDGRDQAGRISSAGVYLYRLEAEDFVMTKRMTLVK